MEEIKEGYFYQAASPIPGNEKVWWPLESPLVMEDYRMRNGKYVVAWGLFTKDAQGYWHYTPKKDIL